MHEETIIRSIEEKANRFNLNCLGVLCGFTVLCVVCNYVGVFTVDHRIMNFTGAAAIICFAFPAAVWLIHDKLQKKSPSILSWNGFKFVIVFSAYAGITVTCVALTFHAVLLMVLPGAFAAQYADQKGLLKWTILGTVILVPLSVYGGFFFGLVDQNLFHGLVQEGVLPLKERIAVCPPHRYVDLFFHYVMPRFLAILIIDILLSGIARRNAYMIAKQMELAEKANTEMKRRNDLQSLIIENLSSVIEFRDENTGEHVVRTKNYVGVLAREMAKDETFRDQLNEELIEEIMNASPHWPKRWRGNRQLQKITCTGFCCVSGY